MCLRNKTESNNTGTSHWLDPRLARVRKHSLGECSEDELPYGWERVTDERYGSYYVDHINRRTQYENPVLQARRLRAEKLAAENSANNQVNGSSSTSELRGERFTLTLTKGPQGLGFTLIGAEGIPEAEGYLQIRSIVPHSPAWIDGALQPGDVLVGVGGCAVRGLSHAQVAQTFQSIAPGTDVTLHVVRGHHSLQLFGIGYPLSFDSEDPNTRVLSTLAVEANAPPTADAVAMQQLTRALRTRFNLESPKHEASPALDEPDGPYMEPSARCSSADILALGEHHSRDPSVNNNEQGRELVLTLRRGAAGFGFTIADSVHGQKVKKVLDRSRCAGLREGDLLLQIGDTDVRHSPHQHVVQVLKECPSLQSTQLRVWRRPARPPRARSASRAHHAHAHALDHAAPTSNQMGRSKTPTAEQLRSSSLHAQEHMHDLHNGMNSEVTYAVPEHKGRDRESLIDRRRRSSTPGGRLTLPAVTPWVDVPAQGHAHWPDGDGWVDNSNVRNWAESAHNWDQGANGNWDANQDRWANGNWGEVPTPTVHVDMNAAYWRGNASVADSSDNGGFPEDGMLHSPTTAAVGGLAHRQSPSTSRMGPHSPSNSTDRLRSHSPSTNSATDRLLGNSPSGRLQSQSPSNNSSTSRVKGSPLRLRDSSPPRHMESPGSRRSPCYQDGVQPQNTVYVANYPQVEAGGGRADPEADVTVRLARGGAGFGFRIVGGTEDGSRVAVGHVVPGGPADGLLRPGDLLTSVDGVPLAGATHARAVHYVCQAAARGHVTLGVRHNRADIQPLGLPTMSAPHPHQTLLAGEPSVHHMPPASYNILHPAPMYPPAPHLPIWNKIEKWVVRHLNVDRWELTTEDAAATNGIVSKIGHFEINISILEQYVVRYGGVQYEGAGGGGGWGVAPYDVTVTRAEGEGFGFVVISSTNKATSTIGEILLQS
ncbi:unnamed protein product [Diatraea saccharalis]|uniref:Uncharacterized protein n=1 Tax=Diatraea saccharalis TaxID=40085 RepID=A0A9N9RG14_9NEOP|nr:unnamed protein product [Diatraea saccharalis]